MKVNDDHKKAIEFATIQTLAILLEVQVITYAEKHFPVKQFPQVDKLRPDTLIGTLQAILARPEAIASLETKGTLRSAAGTFTTWGKKAVSSVSAMIASPPIEYHRLPHLLYFAEKAQQLKKLTSEMIRYSQMSGMAFSEADKTAVSKTAIDLIIELDELFTTTAELTQKKYSLPIIASINNQKREIVGLNGGWGNSEFAKNLTQQILEKYSTQFEGLKSQILQNATYITGTKSLEKSVTIALVESRQARSQLLLAQSQNSYALIQEQLQPVAPSQIPAEPNQPRVEQVIIGAVPHARDEEGFSPLHEAILNNDLVAMRSLFLDGAEAVHKSARGISPLYLAIFDVNEPYKLRDDLNVEVVKLLLERDADPNESLLPLCACSYLHAAVFRYTDSQKYPYELRGKKKINMELVDLLLNHGASVFAVPSNEPAYKSDICVPNIPGIIKDMSNKTPLARRLRTQEVSQLSSLEPIAPMRLVMN
jgi:hypothetical protein